MIDRLSTILVVAGALGCASLKPPLRVKKGEVQIGDLTLKVAWDWGYHSMGTLRGQHVPINAVPTVERLIAAPPEDFYAAAYTSHGEPRPAPRRGGRNIA